MPRLSASLLILCLAAVAAVGLAACGSGGDAKLLPGGTASEISSNLDRVRELAAEDECIGAEEAVQEVSAQVDELGGVDRELKLALREGTERLAAVVSECEEPEETEPAIETAEVPPADEKPEKPKKEKKPKPPEKPVEEAAETTAPDELPPQSNGKGKGKDGEPSEVPPAETPDETPPPSGGVGPGTPAEGE